MVYGSLRYDPSTSQATCGEREISLTVVEGQILGFLMRHAGHVVTHARLAEVLWGEDYPGAVDGLRVHIRRLRAKIEADPSNPAGLSLLPRATTSFVSCVRDLGMLPSSTDRVLLYALTSSRNHTSRVVV